MIADILNARAVSLVRLAGDGAVQPIQVWGLPDDPLLGLSAGRELVRRIVHVQPVSTAVLDRVDVGHVPVDAAVVVEISGGRGGRPERHRGAEGGEPGPCKRSEQVGSGRDRQADAHGPDHRRLADPPPGHAQNEDPEHRPERDRRDGEPRLQHRPPGTGEEGDAGKAMGLTPDWCKNAIAHVGNYGEVFERHLGAATAWFEHLLGEVEGLEGDSDLMQVAQDLPEPSDLLESDDDAPIIRFINAVLTEAIKENASDVHIEPYEKSFRVRYRIDGVLHEEMKPPLKLKEIWAIRIRLQILNRLRDLALFNLAIDSKLRGCDLVRIRVADVAHGSRVLSRATVLQQKTNMPARFESTEQARDAVRD